MTRRRRHGGARPGAGRKPAAGVARSIPIRTMVTPEEHAGIVAQVARSSAPDLSTWTRDTLIAAAQVGATAELARLETKLDSLVERAASADERELDLLFEQVTAASERIAALRAWIGIPDPSPGPTPGWEERAMERFRQSRGQSQRR